MDSLISFRNFSNPLFIHGAVLLFLPGLLGLIFYLWKRDRFLIGVFSFSILAGIVDMYFTHTLEQVFFDRVTYLLWYTWSLSAFVGVVLCWKGRQVEKEQKRTLKWGIVSVALSFIFFFAWLACFYLNHPIVS